MPRKKAPDPDTQPQTIEGLITERDKRKADGYREADYRTGRPTDYRPEYAAQAAKLCGLGATDADLADFFECDVRTIYRWQMKFPEFSHALKESKAAMDARVERSLFQRAMGYKFDAVKIFLPKDADEPVYAPYVEHVPPDTTAMIFWLKNRRKAEWRDRQDVEHGVTDTLASLIAQSMSDPEKSDK